ncbi:MAG: hypothetical protein KDB80_13810 [Planctomycetes bacterium]|nr:hypothetical protein [Planctomycetota bacterium]
MKSALHLSIAMCSCATALAQAPSVQITSDVRETYAQAYGFDWEYDDGTEVAHVGPNSAAEWIDVDGVTLTDWWSIEVGAASFYSESHLGTARIDGLFDCSASTAGNHFQEDASSRASFDVDFTVPALGVRYAFDGEADSSYGYNTANVRLRHVESGSNVLVVTGDHGGSDSLQDRVGWLPAGTYELRSEGEAMAYGNHDYTETQSAHVEFELRLYEPGDPDLDGSVTYADMLAYKNAWKSGSATADVDGNGTVDLSDSHAFELAWRAGFGAQSN